MNQQTLNSQVGIVGLFFVGRLHPSLDCLQHQGKGCLGTWLEVEAAAVAGMAGEKADDPADFELAGTVGMCKRCQGGIPICSADVAASGGGGAWAY
jgi:hypothetical protein